jgi:hypothetical protein
VRETNSTASTTFTALAALIVALVLLQALLAGEWLIGKSTIGVHGAVGAAILLLALAQVGAATSVRSGARSLTLVSTVAFAVLVVLQLILGVSGYDNGGQARAMHIVNGVLLMGLAVWNLVLARRR